MVIFHGSAHHRKSTRKYLLSKNMLFQLYFMNKKEAYAKPFLKEIHTLNVYQINILQILTFQYF